MDTEIAGHGLYFPLDSSEQFSLHCVLTRERANNLFMPSSWWTGFVINSVLGVEDQFVISSADWGNFQLAIPIERWMFVWKVSSMQLEFNTYFISINSLFY